jgi:hypothetical protein
VNKRIKELTEQAGFVRFSPEEDPHTPIDWSSDYTYELEKFAELIVRECANLCNKIYFERYPDAEDFERSEEGDAIKQHFGVES